MSSKNSLDGSQKKLKQARLPFITLNPESGGQPPKRKSTDDSAKPNKKLFCDENRSDDIKEQENVEQKDDKQDLGVMIIDKDSPVKSSENNENCDGETEEDVVLVYEETMTETRGGCPETVKESGKPTDNSSCTPTKPQPEEPVNVTENLTIDSLKDTKSKSLLSPKTPKSGDTSSSQNILATPKSEERLCTPPSSVESSSLRVIEKIDTIDVTPTTTKTSKPRRKTPTPKDLEKKLEREKQKKERELEKQKKLEERERIKKEREMVKKAKEDEKLEKERLKKEKLEQKEKEKQEKEKERLEKEKEKQEKLKKKQEEREKREEEKRQKEEEKKQKEEERRKKEEEEQQKNAKSKAVFRNFFKIKKVNEDATDKPSGIFKQFQIQENMYLAPNCRMPYDTNKARCVDECLNKQQQSGLYVEELKAGIRKPGTFGKTLPPPKEEDVYIIDDENIILERTENMKNYRCKLLQFDENRRPPYWGTWRKKSAKVTRRKPFGKDEDLLNYEIDSDDEWEEEPEGENLEGSEEEKESDDEYEEDLEFFVPHGYLSEDEEGDEDENLSPEAHKVRLHLKAMEFAEERKAKTQPLKPSLVGCVWQSDKKEVPSSLLECAAIMLVKPAIPTKFSNPGASATPVSVSPEASKKVFPEAATSHLIKLVHCNPRKRILLAKEFKEFLLQNGAQFFEEPYIIARRQIELKIIELASWTKCPEAGPMQNRACWYVKPETRQRYGITEDTSSGEQWTYLLEEVQGALNTPKVEKSPTPQNENTIKKFTQPVDKFVIKPEETDASPANVIGANKDRAGKRKGLSPANLQPPKKKIPFITLSKFFNKGDKNNPSKPSEDSDDDIMILSPENTPAKTLPGPAMDKKHSESVGISSKTAQDKKGIESLLTAPICSKVLQEPAELMPAPQLTQLTPVADIQTSGAKTSTPPKVYSKPVTPQAVKKKIPFITLSSPSNRPKNPNKSSETKNDSKS